MKELKCILPKKVHVLFKDIGHVFTRGFLGHLANGSRESNENSWFSTRLKLSEFANFKEILIKFKLPN